MVSPISTDSSFFIFPKIFENNIPIKSPNTKPHSTIPKNDTTHQLILAPVTSQLNIIPRITRKRASAVPSLNILSPSKMRAKRLGAHTDLKIDRTATGSVAEMTDQNRRHTRNGIFKPKRGKRK